MENFLLNMGDIPASYFCLPEGNIIFGRCTLVMCVSLELLKPKQANERQVYATHRAKDGYLCPKGQHPFKTCVIYQRFKICVI